MQRLTALLLLCSTAAAAQDRHTPTVLPGDLAVDLSRIPVGTFQVHVYRVNDGAEQEASTYTYELLRLDHPRGQAIVNVQTSLDGSGVDSIAVDPRTLAPLWERARNPSSWTRLDYTDSVVHGTVSRGGTDQQIDMAVPRAFPSVIADLVVGALPLHPGYSAHIPLFDVRRGSSSLELEEVRPGTFNGRSVWMVDATLGGDKLTLAVDQSSREVLQSEMAMRGMVMRLRRVRTGAKDGP